MTRANDVIIDANGWAKAVYAADFAAWAGWAATQCDPPAYKLD